MRLREDEVVRVRTRAVRNDGTSYAAACADTLSTARGSSWSVIDSRGPQRAGRATESEKGNARSVKPPSHMTSG